MTQTNAADNSPKYEVIAPQVAPTSLMWEMKKFGIQPTLTARTATTKLSCRTPAFGVQTVY
jgi:hypothetical protein